MNIFGRVKTDDELETLKSKLMRLQGSYEFLESQYKDAQINAELARKHENEAIKYLRDLETMLVSYGDCTIRLQDVESRTLKDRVKAIVQALNQMKTSFLEMIEKLRTQLSVTDQELREASRVIEELTETVQEQKITLQSKDEEARTLLDTIQSLQEINQEWEQYRINMEDYIAQLQGQSPGGQHGQVEEQLIEGSSVPFFRNQLDVAKAGEASLKLVEEKRLRHVQPTDVEGFRRLAVQYLSQRSLTTRQIDLIFTIGSEGLSERIQVAKHLGLANSTLKEDFTLLAQEGIIEQEEIVLDGKTYVHKLSSLGVGVYVAHQLDEKAPLVYSEMECAIQDHQNVHHGYFIKDTKYRLIAQGFLEVTDNRKANTRDVSGGKQYVADITAIHPGTKEMWYFECEHVTQSHKELTEKLLKAAQVTSRLYVVVPSKDEAERFEKFYLSYMYVLISNNRTPLPVWMATRRHFKKGEFIQLSLEELSLRYPDLSAEYRKKYSPYKSNRDEDE